jgi:hypothetical protein
VSEEEELAAREKLEKLRRENELIDLGRVLESKNGRAVVWRILGRCGAFRSAFVLGAPDATAFRLGEQNIGQWLLSELSEVDPHALAVMKRENVEDLERYDHNVSTG